MESPRDRLQAAFDGVGPGRAVVLCAPMGMGKSSLLRALAARTPDCVSYAGAAIRSVGRLRDCLAASAGAGWLIVDDADLADPQAIDELVRTIVTGACAGTRIAVAARSRRALSIGALAASGRALVIGATDLAFTLDEAAHVATAHGVTYEPDDLAELLHATDGWPLALAWIVRDVAERQPYLVGAFERWSERNAHLMLEYVGSESCPDAAVRRRFMRALGDMEGTSETVLTDLELAGCPISRTRTRLAPFRMLGRLLIDAAEVPKSKALLDPLSVTLLGRFQCSIGARRVVFARRRDQNVLVFLALAPDGKATRAELQKAFWPGLPAGVAAQGVRSTICRLRRALAAIVGSDVDRYLASRGVVALDFRHVRVDARRFREHVECALQDETSGEKAGQIRHFRAAERIYAGSLLASESIDAALAPRVAEYLGMFDVVSTGLAEERRRVSRPAVLPVPGRAALGGARLALVRPEAS